MAPKHPPGPAMTLDNMRHLGVHRLVATCLNDACRHQGLVDVSNYPGDTEVPSFASKIVCAKCGARSLGKLGAGNLRVNRTCNSYPHEKCSR